MNDFRPGWNRVLAWWKFSILDGVFVDAGCGFPGPSGIVAVLIAAFGFRLGAPYVLAISLMISLLSSQIEVFLAGQMAARLENQLADSIDIMIGAVGAGASVGTAIESAVTESRPAAASVSGRDRRAYSPGR